MHVALDFICAWHHHNVNLLSLCLAASHHSLQPTVYLYIHTIKWSNGNARGRMRILKLPTSWLISLGIGTQYAIMCPPTLSGPSGDTENLTTVSSIYTTHAASPTMTNEFISIFTPRSGSGKVNPVKRKTLWLKLVCYCVLLARAEG